MTEHIKQKRFPIRFATLFAYMNDFTLYTSISHIINYRDIAKKWNTATLDQKSAVIIVEEELTFIFTKRHSLRKQMLAGVPVPED